MLLYECVNFKWEDERPTEHSSCKHKWQDMLDAYCAASVIEGHVRCIPHTLRILMSVKLEIELRKHFNFWGEKVEPLQPYIFFSNSRRKNS